MSSGLRIWDANGKQIFDTSFLSWLILDQEKQLGSNQSGTFSYPDAAGMEVKVLEVPNYDAFGLGGGVGVHLMVQHNVSVSYSLGYPVVTLTPYMSYNIAGQLVDIPMFIYIFVR